MNPLIALIALLALAVLTLGILWLAGPWKPRAPYTGGAQTGYRATAVHRRGDEERTRDLR